MYEGYLDLKILEQVDRLKPQTLKFAQELIRIPSVNPPGDESEAAETIRQKLDSLGMKVNVLEPQPKRVSVLATLKGIHQTPSLLFNGIYRYSAVGDPTKWSVDPF